MLNRRGPRTELWGTEATGVGAEELYPMVTV